MKRKYSTDELVIQGILYSDDKALTFLYKEYSGMIENMVITNNGTKEDARDIFQDTIIIFYEKIKSGTLSLTCSIKTYLFSISRNLWLYRLRKTGRDNSLNESFLVAEQEEIHVDYYYDGESNCENMVDFIHLLGDSCKKILMFFYYEKLSTRDIAAKMNLAGSDYVKTQKYRCLQKLKSIYLNKKQNDL